MWNKKDKFRFFPNFFTQSDSTEGRSRSAELSGPSTDHSPLMLVLRSATTTGRLPLMLDGTVTIPSVKRRRRICGGRRSASANDACTYVYIYIYIYLFIQRPAYVCYHPLQKTAFVSFSNEHLSSEIIFQ